MESLQSQNHLLKVLKITFKWSEILEYRENKRESNKKYRGRKTFKTSVKIFPQNVEYHEEYLFDTDL